MIWVGAEHHAAWRKHPLPIAINEDGCVGRTHTLAALTKNKKLYRATYSSPSLNGILAMVRAGLAVAAIPECSRPDYLVRLGEAEGLPQVKPIEIVLVKGHKSESQAVEYLASEIIMSLGK